LLRRADLVGGRNHLVHALWMHEDVDIRYPPPDLGDVVCGKPAVNGAVATPEDHGGIAQRLRVEAAPRPVRVPDDAVVELNSELEHGRVAPEMLIRQEKNLAALAQRPGKRPPGIG